MKMANSKKKNVTFKEKIATKSGVPSEVILGAPVVNVIGYQELIIMNYRGILEYTDSILRVQTKIGEIKISGKNLDINYYINDEMKIFGRIIKIEYV